MPVTRFSWKLIVWVLAALFVGYIAFTQSPWWRTRQDLRRIESVVGVQLPIHRSDVAIHYATEFSITGYMKIEERDVADFLARMKMKPKQDYLALATWGPQTLHFKDSSRLTGYLGVYGAIEGKNGWEFAYDPASRELWFFVGWSIR